MLGLLRLNTSYFTLLKKLGFESNFDDISANYANYTNYADYEPHIDLQWRRRQSMRYSAIRHEEDIVEVSSRRVRKIGDAVSNSVRT